MFTFTVLGASAMFNGQVSSIEFDHTGTQNINFTTLTVDGSSVFSKTSSDPDPESWAILSPILLTAGTHTIDVAGNLIGTNGSYSGNFNVNVASGVPEAATWAMMLLGFGGMGMVIRRRRKPVLAQLA